ncbi:hypothetical protein [Fictibacillus barbaricus]|uniref:Heme/copper-type cytochrome/quinol oxidase subunit 4 n=1 Tax=Fictibacillus barbaricus TaxID=182136 RepID=A0ABU1TVX7_9BACL|nr:hypothetical protein [Fictibacillus barbaricus]MDR7071365.1 heme/copper-type cytochrome/quinol oxidase subunit 4 [Fictibacillus barbaricus]
MISKKTVYLYVLLMVVMILGIIAVKLGYHVWVNKSSIESFDFNKAYFTATIISIVLFISNIRQYKDSTSISTNKNV